LIVARGLMPKECFCLTYGNIMTQKRSDSELRRDGARSDYLPPITNNRSDAKSGVRLRGILANQWIHQGLRYRFYSPEGFPCM
jgi:hypothetical protein